MIHPANYEIGGVLTFSTVVLGIDLPKLVLDGMDVDIVLLPDGSARVVGKRKNAFVNTGLNITLDKNFGLSGPPANIGWIGITADATAVTATSTTLGGTPSIKPFAPAATRTNQTVTAGANWSQADANSSVVHKVGLLNTATDAGTGLINVIGGSGVAPYNAPFTIDFSSFTTYSYTLQVAVTASAT